MVSHIEDVTGVFYVTCRNVTSKITQNEPSGGSFLSHTRAHRSDILITDVLIVTRALNVYFTGSQPSEEVFPFHVNSH